MYIKMYTNTHTHTRRPQQEHLFSFFKQPSPTVLTYLNAHNNNILSPYVRADPFPESKRPGRGRVYSFGSRQRDTKHSTAYGRASVASFRVFPEGGKTHLNGPNKIDFVSMYHFFDSCRCGKVPLIV